MGMVGVSQLAVVVLPHSPQRSVLFDKNGMLGYVPPPHGCGRQKDREARDEAAAKEGDGTKKDEKSKDNVADKKPEDKKPAEKKPAEKK